MRHMLRRAALLMLLACVGTAPAAAGEVVQVTIGDLAFSPAEITARLGDTVEWVNGDFIDHTATANGGNWEVMVIAGSSAQLRLTHAGMFEYFCRFHPNMKAKIHVSAD
jgi:plastocyanin